MALREVIRQLLDGLSSEGAVVFQDAVVNGFLMMERHYRHAWIERVVADRELFDEEAGGESDPERFRASQFLRIRQQYDKLLPATLLDLQLSEEEFEALVSAALELLDGSATAAIGGANMLASTNCRGAVPKLTRMLRQHADVNAVAAGAAIRALSEIMTWNFDPAHPLTVEERDAFHEAATVLKSIATSPADYLPRPAPERLPDPSWELVPNPGGGVVDHPRKLARETLLRVVAKFRAPPSDVDGDGPEDEARGADRPMIRWTVETVRATASGAAVSGQGGEPRIGTMGTVHVAGRPPIQARFAGFTFHVDAWPPIVELLLDGVAPADVPGGARITSSFRQQMQGQVSEAKLDRYHELLEQEGVTPGELLAVFNESE
jgi:hypothetical protein